MQAALRRWGNSIGLRIPARLLAELNLSENSIVDIAVEGGKLTVAPRQKRTWKYSLEQLLAGVTKENAHPETDWGGPVGEEVW